METVSALINLIAQQVVEAKDRATRVASQIAGPVPQGGQTTGNSTGAPTLIDVLRAITHALGETLMEIERAERSLSF